MTNIGLAKRLIISAVKIKRFYFYFDVAWRVRRTMGYRNFFFIRSKLKTWTSYLVRRFTKHFYFKTPNSEFAFSHLARCISLICQFFTCRTNSILPHFCKSIYYKRLKILSLIIEHIGFFLLFANKKINIKLLSLWKNY